MSTSVVSSTSVKYHEYIGGVQYIRLIPSVRRGDIMSTSGDVQYIGGYHECIGGYHEYIGGCHEYIEGCSVHRGFQ